MGRSPPIDFTLTRRWLLQVCSGSGDWILRQCRLYPAVDWVAVELRHHRCASLFSRMVLEGVTNLAILCADATSVFKDMIKPTSVTNVRRACL
jgi:tRNA G46 methylase TrmB